jgi:molybdenum cofactor guanylyltransferase
VTSIVTSIILAGGLSKRMGQDKALLEIAGRPLLQRVIHVAQSVSSPVLVVTAWPEKYQAMVGCEFLCDRFSQGPIVAFAQGLAPIEAEWVLLLSCDLPNLQSAVLQTWINQLKKVPDRAIAYLPSGSKGWEPLCGFYRSACRESIQEYVNNGGRSFQGWLQNQVVETLVVDDRSVLLNCNTPEDLRSVIFPRNNN